MTWVAAVLVLLLGFLLGATPSVSRSTVPLGVSVPSSRVAEPSVVTALRRYRVGTALSVAVSLALLVLPLDDAVRLVLSLAVVLAGIAASYSVCRRGIIRAKAAGSWYEGEQVRLVASLDEPRVRLPHTAWFTLAGIINAAVLGYGVASYDSLPQRIATHTSLDGTPDAWSAKSPWAVFTLPVVGIVVTLTLAWAAIAVERGSRRVQPDGDLVAARERSRLVTSETCRVLAVLSVLSAAGLAVQTVFMWREVRGTLVAAATVALMVVPLVVIVGLMLRIRRMQTPAASPVSSAVDVAPGRYAQSPDDDRYWKWGVIYCNPNDPATIVPKRTGIGVTVNVATPGGKAFVGVVGLLVAGSILAGVVGALM